MLKVILNSSGMVGTGQDIIRGKKPGKMDFLKKSQGKLKFIITLLSYH